MHLLTSTRWSFKKRGTTLQVIRRQLQQACMSQLNPEMLNPLQGYFRDVTQEDVAALLPTFANPLEDPIFLIPPIGRHYSSHSDFEPAALVPISHRGSRQPAHAPLLKDRVSELKAQAAAEVNFLPSCLHGTLPLKAICTSQTL